MTMSREESAIFRRLVIQGRKKYRALNRACGRRLRKDRNEVELSVEDALAYFHGTDEDRYRWEGAAYVIGADEFRELLFERQSNEAAGKASRNPITAFQSRLTRAVMKVINNCHATT